MLKQLTAPLAKNKLSILIFHQVMESRDPFRMGDPTVPEFEAQMQLLRRFFNPIALADAVKLLAEGQLPAHSVAVTFDDGYLDNLTLAAPVLERYQIPATFFVTTGFFEENMWNDRVIGLFEARRGGSLDLQPLGKETIELQTHEQAVSQLNTVINLLKYLPLDERLQMITALESLNSVTEQPRKMMQPDEIRALYGKGFEIGGHTKHHPILAKLDPAEQTQQIKINKDELEGIIDHPVTGFAYPNGKPEQDYTAASVATVKDLGFSYAVSTAKGVSTPATDPFQLLRFTPWDKQLAKFYLRLLHNQLMP